MGVAMTWVTGGVGTLGELHRLAAALEGKPFRWGYDDCTIFAARWAEMIGGARLDRPTYRSKREAQALIAEAGGLDRLVAPILETAGWRELAVGEEPRLGDIGIIRTKIGDAAGVWMHSYQFAQRGARGVLRFGVLKNRVVKSWRRPENGKE